MIQQDKLACELIHPAVSSEFDTKLEKPEQSQNHRINLLMWIIVIVTSRLLRIRPLCSCSYVSRRLNELTKHNPLWKSICSKHWLLTE